MELPKPPETKELDWYSEPSKKKIEQIKKMMAEGKEITPRSVTKELKGSQAMIRKLLAWKGNAAIIDAHNYKVWAN